MKHKMWKSGCLVQNCYGQSVNLFDNDSIVRVPDRSVLLFISDEFVPADRIGAAPQIKKNFLFDGKMYFALATEKSWNAMFRVVE